MAQHTFSFPYQVRDTDNRLPNLNGYRQYDKLITGLSVYYQEPTAAGKTVYGVLDVNSPALPSYLNGIQQAGVILAAFTSLTSAATDSPPGETVIFLDLVNPFLVRNTDKLGLHWNLTATDPGLKVVTTFQYVNQSGVPTQQLYQG